MQLVDLRKTWLFEGMTEDEARTASEIVEYRLCPAETVVVEAGTAGRSLFIVQSGSVRIVRREEGKETPIAEVLPGQHFGEVSFIDGGVRTATAITNEPSELLVIEPRQLERLAQSQPMIGYKFSRALLRLLCQRLRNTDFWLFELMVSKEPENEPAGVA